MQTGVESAGAGPPPVWLLAFTVMDPIRSFDALVPGTAFDLGGFSLSREEIVAFAGRYDAQPFHLDEEAGRASVFGGLVASGLHTLSAAVGHMIRSGLLAEVSQGGGAMEVKWPAPVRPEERLLMRIEVVETRASASKPGLGIAMLRYLLTREADGVVVMQVLATHFLRRQPMQPGSDGGPQPGGEATVR